MIDSREKPDFQRVIGKKNIFCVSTEKDTVPEKYPWFLALKKIPKITLFLLNRMESWENQRASYSYCWEKYFQKILEQSSAKTIAKN